MAETVHQNPLARLKAIPFDRAMASAMAAFLLALAVTLVMSLTGNTPWTGWEPRSFRFDTHIDLFFGILYTALILLCGQNFRFFYLTREPVYLTYCFYITVLTLHVVLYERLPHALGFETPQPWGLAASLTFSGFSYVFIFRFARQLLTSPETWPRADLALRLGAVTALIPPGLILAGFVDAFIVFEPVWYFVFGMILIYISGQAARRGNIAALILCLSFLMQFIGYFWSTAILFLPDAMSPFMIVYSDDTVRASSAIFIGSLMLEALLMSSAAQEHVRKIGSAAKAAEVKAAKLDKALKVAKAQLATAARRAEQAEGARTPVKPGSSHPPQLAPVLRKIIETNAAEPFIDVDFLANAASTSRATLLRRLKQETRLSPNALIRETRLDLAHRLLKDGQVRTIGEVLGRCGFANQGHFTRRYTERFGESPQESLKTADS